MDISFVLHFFLVPLCYCFSCLARCRNVEKEIKMNFYLRAEARVLRLFTMYRRFVSTFFYKNIKRCDASMKKRSETETVETDEYAHCVNKNSKFFVHIYILERHGVDQIRMHSSYVREYLSANYAHAFSSAYVFGWMWMNVWMGSLASESDARVYVYGCDEHVSTWKVKTTEEIMCINDFFFISFCCFSSLCAACVCVRKCQMT